MPRTRFAENCGLATLLATVLAVTGCAQQEGVRYEIRKTRYGVQVEREIIDTAKTQVPQPDGTGAWQTIGSGEIVYRESVEPHYRYAALQAEPAQLAALPYPFGAEQRDTLAFTHINGAEAYCAVWEKNPGTAQPPETDNGLACLLDAQHDGRFESMLYKPAAKYLSEQRAAIEPLPYTTEDRFAYDRTWVSFVIRVTALTPDHILLALHGGADTEFAPKSPESALDKLPRRELFGFPLTEAGGPIKVQWGGAIMEFRRAGERAQVRVLKGFDEWISIVHDQTQLLQKNLAPPQRVVSP